MNDVKTQAIQQLVDLINDIGIEKLEKDGLLLQDNQKIPSLKYDNMIQSTNTQEEETLQTLEVENSSSNKVIVVVKKQSSDDNETTQEFKKYLIDMLTSSNNNLQIQEEQFQIPTEEFKAIVNGEVSISSIVNNFGGMKSTAVANGEVSVSSIVNDIGGMKAFKSNANYTGMNGSGYSIVIMDSGIDLDNSFFGADLNGDGIADRIIYTQDFTREGDGTVDDFNGHGTHVASIAASSDSVYGGVASGANIIVLQVANSIGSVSDTNIEKALQWVVANASKYNIASVNMSIGFKSNHDVDTPAYLCSDEFASLKKMDVMTCVAAGNDYATYQTTGVSRPACDPSVITVGASNDDGTIASFSQRGDLVEIFAPGVNIIGALAQESNLVYSKYKVGDNAIALSGTSMATPFIAGLVAVAQQIAVRDLGRKLTQNEFVKLLQLTGDTFIDKEINDGVVNSGTIYKNVNVDNLAKAITDMYHLAIIGTDDDDLLKVTNSNGQIVYGYGGNDTLIGGEGNDLLDGGLGNDTVSYNNTERKKGIEVNLLEEKSYDLSDVSLGKTDDKKVVFNNTTLSNLDLNKYNFKLFGSWLNDQNLKAEVKLVDKNYFYDFWVVGVDGTYTKARKIELKDTDNGIEAKALEAKYIDKIDLNFDFNTGGSLVDVSENYSVRIESGNSTLNDTLVNIENIEGSIYNDILVGNSANNILDGKEGNDYLDGGIGADTMIGGLGNDTFVVDDVNDKVIENTNEGIDTVQSNISYVLGDNLENLTLLGNTAINGTGNALNNTIIGNSANNILDGKAGNDYLNGGAGNNYLNGGEGTDTASYNNAERTKGIEVNLSEGKSYDLSDVKLEGGYDYKIVFNNTTLSNLDLNKYNFKLFGRLNDQNLKAEVKLVDKNYFYGYQEINFWVVGVEGTYTIAIKIELRLTTDGIKAIILGAAKYIDKIDLNFDFNTGGNFIRNLSDYSVIIESGNSTLKDTLVNIENVEGSIYNDILVGNTANNTLDGKAGADTMIGGLGNDTFVVDDVNDKVIENTNEGIDTVQSNISYVLGDNLENLTLLGNTAINGTGNQVILH